MDEDIPGVIGIIRDEIGGPRGKGHIASIGRDGRLVGITRFSVYREIKIDSGDAPVQNNSRSILISNLSPGGHRWLLQRSPYLLNPRFET
jgi:hypothetical protein